jgi:hypothetical protein
VAKLSSFVQKDRTKVAIFTTPLSKALGIHKEKRWRIMLSMVAFDQKEE